MIIKIKRLFDLFVAVPCIIVFLPIMLLISLLLLVSGGDIFFRQDRVGMKGRVFKIIKFRTMIPEVDSTGCSVTAATNRRITKIGRVLRRYKLDELPQLFNVLVGHMSLVGPRPEVPRYVARYPDDVREIILSVRPGITDLASLEFYDEERRLMNAADVEHTYIHEIMPEKLRLAMRYVKERNFLLDMTLLMKTIRKLLRRK